MTAPAVPGPRPPALFSALVALALVACATLPYVATWSYGFVDYGDEAATRPLPPAATGRSPVLPEFFHPERYPPPSEYRPLPALSFALDHALAGPAAPGFRAQQQLWYALGVLMVWLWLRAVLRAAADAGRLSVRATSPDAIAAITAALFALHPVHVEAVTWLSGREALLCTMFMCAALWSACRVQSAAEGRAFGGLLGCFGAASLALLSSPAAIALPLIALLQHVCSDRESRSVWALMRSRAVLYAGLWVLAAGATALYLPLPDGERGRLAAPQAAAWLFAEAPVGLRWGQQLLAYAELSLWPLRLSPVLPCAWIDPAWHAPRALLGLASAIALLACALLGLRYRRAWLLAPGLFVLPVMPALLLPRDAPYIEGRDVQLALVGPLVALVWLGAWCCERRPGLGRIGIVCALVLAGLLGERTVDYNRRWDSSLNLWMGSLQVLPHFSQLYDNAARAAVRARTPRVALKVLERCLAVNPDDPRCSLALGTMVLAADPERGEHLLRTGLPVDTTGKGHFALARHMIGSGRTAAGYKLYADWLAAQPRERDGELEPLLQLAVLARMPDEALRVGQRLLRARTRTAPAAPPPRAALIALARLTRDAALAARIEQALARCEQNACVQRELGW